MLENIREIEEYTMREFLKLLHEQKLYTRFTAMLPHQFNYKAFLSKNYLYNPHIRVSLLKNIKSFDNLVDFLHNNAMGASKTIQEAAMKGSNYLVHTFVEPYLKEHQRAPEIACGFYNAICRKFLGDAFTDEKVEDLHIGDELMQKLEDMSQEDRSRIFSQMLEYIKGQMAQTSSIPRGAFEPSFYTSPYTSPYQAVNSYTSNANSEATNNISHIHRRYNEVLDTIQTNDLDELF